MLNRIEGLVKICFFPVLVSGLMASSLYVFYYEFCEPLLSQSTTRNTGKMVTLGTVSLWCLCMCCYIQILRVPPGRPKKVTKVSPEKNDESPTQLISVCQENGTPRFCKICKSLKPERSHHCRVCDICVLKMDHHCSWINGCVGYQNHKIFFLFLLYTMIYVVWLFYNCVCLVLGTVNIKPYSSSLKFIWSMYKAYFVTVGNIIWNIWQSAWSRSWIPLLTGTPTLNIAIKFQIIVMLYLTFIFGAFLTGLTIIQLYLILHNRTTLEHIASHEQYIRFGITSDVDSTTTTTENNNFDVVCFFPPEKRLYDIGLWKNWKVVMGEQWHLWLVPTRRCSQPLDDDGCVFPYGDQAYQRIIHEASSTSK